MTLGRGNYVVLIAEMILDVLILRVVHGRNFENLFSS